MIIMSCYKVEFNVGGSRSIQKDIPEHWGILDIKDGFWVNEDLDLTNGSDCRYYVMPHHINFIEKVKSDE